MLSTASSLCEAQVAWNLLNGVINVYKPPMTKVQQVRSAILHNLCKDLNQLEVSQPRKRIAIEPGGGQKFIVRETENFADNILTVGPRYQMQDFKCGIGANLGFHTSGVLVLGINSGVKQSFRLQINQPIRVYHVNGKFGRSTESHFADSRITSKATYHHIWDERFSSICSSLQASHQRKMFEMCGVDLQSQAAYELASKGPIRPADKTLPVIYGIKLVHFLKPEFTLEVHAINADENYLAALVNDIAIELRSVAHCVGIRCIRHGHFSIDDSLLRRHWTLNGVLNNMEICRKILIEHPNLLYQQKAELSSA